MARYGFEMSQKMSVLMGNKWWIGITLLNISTNVRLPFILMTMTNIILALRKEWLPLAVSFLYQAFKTKHVVLLPQEQFKEQLDRNSIRLFAPISTAILVSYCCFQRLDCWYGLSILKGTESYETALSELQSSRKQHKEFLESGVVTDGLLQACIVLAQLDVVFRRKALISDFLQFDEGDLHDLRQLLNVVPRNTFDYQDVCLLDPTFGIGSLLVGGADVDLVVDDMIIDIKTTKKPTLKRHHFNQIIGYYMLHRIGSLDGASKGHSIQRLGIYYSRYAILKTFDIQEIVPDDKFDEFLPWFIERTQAEFGTNF